MKKDSVCVVFTTELSKRIQKQLCQFEVIVAPTALQIEVEKSGCMWVSLEEFVEAGSIYEASALVEELSQLTMPDGTRLTKSFLYKGYELWWMRYQNLFFRFCFPYTQYKKLLIYVVKNFKEVTLYEPPFKNLFTCYLETYQCRVTTVKKSDLRAPSWLPFGMVVQIMLTLIFIPLLMVQRRSIMVFTGDKFVQGKDYDFRMKYIYEELREKKLPFVEFIRSLESWKNVLSHAITRRRPVIYSEAITFIGRFVSILTGGQRRARRKFGAQNFVLVADKETRFKLLIATQYLLGVYDDIWAIRISKWVLRSIGVQSAFIAAAAERNFHAVMGCKLNDIPTVGILHGVASRYYNLYDFLPKYDGEKTLSVDKYGLWSEWWKEYYVKHSSTYSAEQLIISGPMLPMQTPIVPFRDTHAVDGQQIKVLLVSEVVAVPEEVIPYLDALMKVADFSVYIKFRATHDSFEKWLMDNRPDILVALGGEKILKGNMHEAIARCDVVVGSQSTGVIEATILDKPFVFFNTKKWGDYFDMKSFSAQHQFFAENSEELIMYVRKGKDIPIPVLKDIQERYFGNPYKNGSAWVVDQLVAKLH